MLALPLATQSAAPNAGAIYVFVKPFARLVPFRIGPSSRYLALRGASFLPSGSRTLYPNTLLSSEPSPNHAPAYPTAPSRPPARTRKGISSARPVPGVFAFPQQRKNREGLCPLKN